VRIAGTPGQRERSCHHVSKEIRMSYSTDYYGAVSAAQAPAEARAAFIRRTYGHLAGAVLAFIAIEAVLLQLPGIEKVVLQMPNMWIVVLLGFMVVSWLANSWANSNTSVGMQYLGLSLYVLAEAIIFLPLLYIAEYAYPGKHLISQAGIMTGAVFAGLTLTVLVTGKDYSFLGPVLSIGSLLALGFIFAAMIFGFSLGLIFMFAMVALASVSIVYNTSNVVHRYGTHQHVAAALSLFASVALLFWYILQIAMASSRD
jgi:FtsH-binding integral membrane protein